MPRCLTHALLSSLALVIALRSSPARAQACVNDNDPRTSGTPTACDDAAACPNPGVPDDASHYLGGTLVYMPQSNLGACHPGAPNTFGNGCTLASASCLGGQCIVGMTGLMYRPASARPQAPAVLLVPGSTACVPMGGACVYRPERFCGIKSALLAKGYVVMEVLPRGYGIDATHGSTGYYINLAIAQQVAMGAPCAATPYKCGTYDEIDEGLFDVTTAYQFLASRTFVNPAAIGVFGHSLGGIRALAFNRVDHGQKATVTVAAASESWCANGTANSILWGEMANSIDLARSATYNLMAQNDVNLESGSVLAHEAAENRWQYQAAVFPPVSQAGVSHLFGDEAHACFMTNQRNVDQWAPSVIDFYARYGVQ